VHVLQVRLTLVYMRVVVDMEVMFQVQVAQVVQVVAEPEVQEVIILALLEQQTQAAVVAVQEMLQVVLFLNQGVLVAQESF
tara:strand:- start:22 stop:264 length:243 start_codon:yes stop_codon:yes gene_type:complete